MEKYLIASYSTFAREPVIRKLKDGMLVCLALTGGETEPDNRNVVVKTESHDKGATWTTPNILFSHLKRGCWATEIFTAGKKDVAVVHTYNAESWYLELQTFFSDYEADTHAWTEPKSFYGPLNGCSLRQGILLSNGDYLFPLYWQQVNSAFDCFANKNFNSKEYPFVCGVAVSCDEGITYQRYGYITSDVTLWEPNVVEIENGHIIMYCRSDKTRLFISESFDYGRTWTKGYFSDIPNPNSKITVLKVNDTVLLINNFCNGRNLDGWGNRTNLSIYKSHDGKNFEKVVDVCDENEIAFYPHAFADFDERILYVAYENAKEHYLKKYTFEELGL